MSAVDALDDCVVALAPLPPTDAFGLHLSIDGEDILLPVSAEGPGIFRTIRRVTGEAATLDGKLLAKGDIIGFLQRGVLLMPVVMPEDGWVVVCAPDRTRVEHGVMVARYIVARDTITP